MIDLKLGELYTTRDESLVEAAKGILIDSAGTEQVCQKGEIRHGPPPDCRYGFRSFDALLAALLPLKKNFQIFLIKSFRFRIIAMNTNKNEKGVSLVCIKSTLKS